MPFRPNRYKNPHQTPRFLPLMIGLLTLAFGCSVYANETDLKLPSLDLVKFHGVTGRALLMGGLVVCLAGLIFGLIIYRHLRQLPVHRAMLEVSELIYETCKTYLKTQIKFILILEAFIGSHHRDLLRGHRGKIGG